jgi:hypothetical protein
MKFTSGKEKREFVQWCIDNDHIIIAEKYADAQHFPEFFPKKTKAERQRFCNDNREYYRTIYLQSDHWKELRERKLSKNRFCESCGNAENLDVHHLRYKNLLDVTEEDLKVLCRICHDIEHNEEKLFLQFSQS